MDRDYLIWLAGFIDADGSFTIGLRKRKRVDGSVNLTVAPVINVRQKAKTGTALVLEIKDMLGCGKFYESTRNDGTSAVTWQTTSSIEVVEVGSLLYEHLRLKQGEAEKAIRCAYLILESVDGYNHDPDTLWELYTLYRDINPEGNWADRKVIYTKEEISEIALQNAKRYNRKVTAAHNGLNSLPKDALRRIIGK